MRNQTSIRILLLCLIFLLAMASMCAAKEWVGIWSEGGNLLGGEYFVAKINQKTVKAVEWEKRKYLDCSIKKNIRGLALGLFPAEETFGDWHVMIDIEHGRFFILSYYDRERNPSHGTSDMASAKDASRWEVSAGHFPENAVAWVQKNRPGLYTEITSHNAPLDEEHKAKMQERMASVLTDSTMDMKEIDKVISSEEEGFFLDSIEFESDIITSDIETLEGISEE